MVTTVTLEKVVVIGVAIGLVLRGAPLVPAGAPARRILSPACWCSAAIVISGFQATYVGPVLREGLKQLEYLVMFWCAVSLVIDQREDLRWLQGGIIASVLVVSFDAVAQGLLGGAPSGVWINGHRLAARGRPARRARISWADSSRWRCRCCSCRRCCSASVCGALRWVAIFAAALAIPMTLSRSGVAFALLGFIAGLVHRPFRSA